ncbi:hypothetical protein [Acinetobacter radioresistens]|uniref:hypothetical protein n=1 Tax=Acinetobacter radioresistens TaxID=40216 RepID=UPI00028DA10A|nr:hypothetical protein [Acinetobacter radioresistens]BBL22172.1 hypothetical protein ACRAD_28430 [Acinetobacter radioresistens DSM 6976 = NBRC 102413 = CIP 103788]
MLNIIDPIVIPIPPYKEPVDLDEVLKQSKKDALSDPKYLNEIDRIHSFLSNIKKTNPNDVDFIEKIQGESVPFLDQLYSNLQVLEDNMCQYPECLMGISDDLLESVRIVDSLVNVSDSVGRVHTLKQGDLIIRYDSGKAGYGYIVKNGSRSSRYEEQHLSSTSDLNYKVIGDNHSTLNNDWLFISDNFISALAIHHATGVMTIAIPRLDSALIEEVLSKYTSKKAMLFIEASDQVADTIAAIKVAYPISRKGQSWAECRDMCLKDFEEKQAMEEFKKLLRHSMKNALK